jgi:predicted tellurium resistance membrane protein TerC
MIEIPDFLAVGTWISLLTLTFLEVVLGIDNIIFISILTDKLPLSQQRRVRNIGLILAMFFRLGLLLTINWIIGLKAVVLSIPNVIAPGQATLDLSYKDLILIAGGLFLIVKSTLEIHHKITDSNSDGQSGRKRVSSMTALLFQIVLIDAVFSFDSILTAVGLVEHVFIMMVAVVISIGVMMLFAGGISRLISSNPSLQILALSFLVVIGVVLIADGLHQHISKSIIYSCLCFSLTVEILNIRLRKNNSLKK